MAEPLIARFEGMCRLAALAVVLSLFVACGPDKGGPPPGSPSPLTEPYRLTGTVTDAMSGGAVQGARLEARNDPGESSTPVSVTFAQLDGSYRLVNLPGVVYVRVTKFPYTAATERIDLTKNARRDFSIALDPNIPELAGSYTLTIEADDACPSAPSPLPPHLRRRTFPARIERGERSLTVYVGCSYGQGEGCRIAGFASDSGATFSLGIKPEDNGAFDGEDLTETIPINGNPGQHLVFLGTATTNFTPTGLLGSLNGTITLYPLSPPIYFRLPSPGACRAGRFELTRR